MNNNGLLVSSKVAYYIAKPNKNRTIAEELIHAEAIDMVKIIIGEGTAKQIQIVEMSNSTVSRRIDNAADNISEQLLLVLK